MADNNDPSWERAVIEKLVLETLTEQRRRRRWGIFFKLLAFLYLTVVLMATVDWQTSSERLADGKKHTALVQMTGVISAKSDASAEHVIDALQAAFEDKGTAAVVLRINSPGGSPVQSAYVYEEIRRIKKERPDLPIYAVISDMCASGCYYIAAAADRIYVHPSSVVGSIGVIMNGFGFVETMQRLGVERRLMTAGAHKALLDPFSPVNEVEKQHLQGVIDSVHSQFINAIKQGRGERLKETPETFSGLVWNGEQAVTLGLADAVGDARSVAQDVIKEKETVNFTPRERLIDRISHRLGTSLSASLQSAVGLDFKLR